MNKCFYCYNDLDSKYSNFHPKCAKNIFGVNKIENSLLSLKNLDLQEITKSYISNRLTIPGVQKKLSVKISLDKSLSNKDSNRLTIMGFLNGTHILKPSCEEYPNLPEIEDLSMKIATLLGIKTAEHSLIPIESKDGKMEIAYICKRFDRIKNKKIAMEDFCQLANKFTEEKYKGSAELIAKIITKYSSNPGDDLLRFIELLLHSFIIGNADMHLKNFSFITDNLNFIHLSPAYDLVATRLLIPEHLDKEELALPINGRKNNIRLKDFYVLASDYNIPNKVITNIVKRINSKIGKIEDLIKRSFLPEKQKNDFILLIKERINRISI